MSNNLKFIHLRTHSSYSLSEGAVRPEEIAGFAANNDMPALALTDSGNLFGLLEITLSCQKNGVQLIPAVEIYFTEDKENKANELNKVVLIGQNEKGYLNLLKIVSNSFLHNDDSSTPSISWGDIENNNDNEGLILLTGGYNGILDSKIREGQIADAESLLVKLSNIFAGRIYIELNRLGQQKEVETEAVLLKFAKSKNLPIVATNNVMFPTKEMSEAQDALMCIAGGNVVDDDSRDRCSAEQYFKSQDEMAELFTDLPEALESTIKIAKRCSYLARAEAPMLPDFPCEGGRTAAEEIKAQAFTGLCNRLAIEVDDKESQDGKYKDYFTRLDFEIDVINNMGFPGYFLIVSDFIKWAKSQDIPVGPGRGSGAGSVVAWAMQITNLDPLRFGLLFERFLNPERVSMPDFDIDFCQERRGEVIHYVQDRYGYENVAQIITFGKLQARAVLRDVGRVMQIPYSKTDRICKMIPFNPIDPVTLAKAVEMDPELQAERDNDEVIGKLIDIGLKLEGMHRHASTHAAGVVIGPKPLTEILPIYSDPRSPMPITQYSMKYSEVAGLVKFDFLGLKTLTLISKAVAMIKVNEGFDIDIGQIPLDDERTFSMLAEGKGNGVFQMESAGMQDAMRKMKVDSFEDIIALISLYRPGPMENIPRYIACKLGREKPDYLHPMLEECLKETYGVIIYQEQVMQIAQIMGGYSLGAADLLRRAMGKKIKAEMDAQRELFVKGAVENKVQKKKAEEIFDLVAKFAGYGFNKSHAAAYALIGYQTAYLKAHYPAEFICACLNMVIGDTDKILMFREEARRMGIDILSPSINNSYAHFVTEKNKESGEKAIRYALGALKNVGIDAVEILESERRENGNYKSLSDFISRVPKQVMNKRQTESLAACGAFDEIHNNRRQLFEEATILVRYNASFQEEKNDDQSSLFASVDTPESRDVRLQNIEDWADEEKSFKEFDAIGFYLGKHPVTNYLSILPENRFMRIQDMEDKVPYQSNEIKKDKYGRRQRPKGFELLLIGVPNRVVHRTSNGRRFSYFSLSDPTGMTEINIFNDELINKARDILEDKNVIIVRAEARRDEGGIRTQASDIITVDEFLESLSARAEITIEEGSQGEELVSKLSGLAGNDNLKAPIPIRISIKTNNGFLVKMKLPNKFSAERKQLSTLMKGYKDIDFKIIEG